MADTAEVERFVHPSLEALRTSPNDTLETLRKRMAQRAKGEVLRRSRDTDADAVQVRGEDGLIQHGDGASVVRVDHRGVLVEKQVQR